MANHSAVPSLPAGVFFGEPCRFVNTPSFEFRELQATVPEPQVPRHTHETPHFILITQGVYQTEARNQPGVCSPGTLIFNPAGTTHRDCFRSTRGRFLSICPGAEAARMLGQTSPLPRVVGGVGLHGSNDPLIDDRMIGDRIVHELRCGLPSSTMVLECLGLELIGGLAHLGERSGSRTAPGWLMQARELIDDRVCDDLSITDVATSAGVHPVYLARAFRRYFQCSPGEYLRRRRLHRVQQLLFGTDLPLAQIALQCGFSDQSQMTRAFSSTFGMPPARYRWLHRQ
jgi:AraC family transcriptional regulator